VLPLRDRTSTQANPQTGRAQMLVPRVVRLSHSESMLADSERPSANERDRSGIFKLWVTQCGTLELEATDVPVTQRDMSQGAVQVIAGSP
jgi:hypothetical protein